MKIRDEIQGKILSLKVKLAADINALEAKATKEIDELQTILDSAEGWLAKDTDTFQKKVNRLVAKIRET